MNRLFVAAQDLQTREWIPVAELRERNDGYELRYTNGAARLPGFIGLGRMQALDKVYHSKVLFPFFSNRLISKSRPEYRDYLRWLGFDHSPQSPLEELAISGGVRATDGYELIAPPRYEDGRVKINFFPRGVRYLPASAIELLSVQDQNSKILLMRDVQNPKDPRALAIRTETPYPGLIGYVPRYYCEGVCRLLDRSPTGVELRIRRVNSDAPLDMKILLSIDSQVEKDFDLLADVSDFLPLTTSKFEQRSKDIFSKADLEFLKG